MAGVDYRRCDVCRGKAFYDADLNYDYDKTDKDGNDKLGYVGSMKVLCDECSKTHMIVIVDFRLMPPHFNNNRIVLYGIRQTQISFSYSYKIRRDLAH